MPEGTRIERLYYEIDAETGRLTKGLTAAEASVGRFATTASGSGSRATQGLGLAAVQAGTQVRQMAAAADATAASTGRLQASAGGLSRLLVGLGSALGVRQLVEYADTWTLVSNRLRLVSDSAEGLAVTQRELFRIAQDTRTGYEGTADVFSRLARNADELGLSQGDLLTVTQAINQSLRISGASASSAQAALVQLGQAFASGTLRGEELNSVLEQSPRLAEAIARGLGVTVGELRKLGEAGALSAKAVADALRGQASAIDSEFSQMQGTVSESFTQIRNAALRFIGEASEATGASVALAGGLSLLARNFGLAANAAILFAAAAVGRSLVGAVDRVRALAGAQVAAAAAAEGAATAQARAALVQAAADTKQAVATERNIAATVRRLRTEQAALARSEQRARADLAAARGAEAAATANLAAARSADARALAETRLEMAVVRRTRASAALRGVEAQQIATNRLIGQNLILLGAAQNGAASAAAKSGAAFTGFARTLTGVSTGARLASLGMGAFRTVVAFFGGPVIAGIIAGIMGISTALGLVKKNAAVAKEEMASFAATLEGETESNLLAGQARVLDQIAGARRRAMDPRAAQGQRSAAADEVPRLQELLQAYKGVIAAKKESSEVRTPQGNLDAEAKSLADLIRLGQANNKERARARDIIRETQATLAATTASDEKSQAARIRLQERINLLTEADSKQRKGAIKDAEALARVMERADGLEMQVSGADELARTRVELNKLADDARDAGLAGEALRSFEERLQAIYQTAKDRSVKVMGDELRDLAAAMTVTAADDLAIEIEKLEEKFKGATGTTREQADALIKAKREMREATVAAEDLTRKLQELRDLNAGGARTDMAAMGELLAMRDGEQANLRGADTDDKRERIKARIRDIDKDIAELQAKTAALLQQQKDAEAELETTTQRVAGAVENVANAAFGIVSAFAGANSEAARLLGSIGQVAGGISKLSALAKDAGGFKELFSTGKGVASAIGPIGAAVGGAMAIGSLLFGEGPEVARRREANTKALEDLTRAVGSLDLGDTAQNRATAVRVAAGVAGRDFGGDIGVGSTPLSRQNDALNDALAAADMSFEEFKRQATGLGVEVGKLGHVTRDQLEAIAKAADTLGARLDTMREGFEVLDTEPAERLAETLALLAEKGDEYSKALAVQVQGYDLATDAGRAAAEAAVRAAFEIENSPISAELAKELLGMIGDVTEAARSARAEIIRGTKDEIGFFDQGDPGEQLDRITTAYGEQIPALAALREGLDLTTREGLEKFNERLAAFYRGVKDGSIAIEGFTVDEIVAALFDIESAADSAATGIAQSAEAIADATKGLNLEARGLRASGQSDAADIVEFDQRQADEMAGAIAAGVSQATLDELTSVQGKEREQFLAGLADAIEGTGSDSAASRSGREGVDLAPQLTELTGVRIADYLASSQAILGQYLPSISEHTAAVVAALTGGLTTAALAPLRSPLAAPSVPSSQTFNAPVTIENRPTINVRVEAPTDGTPLAAVEGAARAGVMAGLREADRLNQGLAQRRGITNLYSGRTEAA